MGKVDLVLEQWQVAWGHLLACSLAVLLAWAACLGVAARKWTLLRCQVFALSGHVAWSQLGNGHVQVSGHATTALLPYLHVSGVTMCSVYVQALVLCSALVQ